MWLTIKGEEMRVWLFMCVANNKGGGDEGVANNKGEEMRVWLINM